MPRKVIRAIAVTLLSAFLLSAAGASGPAGAAETALNDQELRALKTIARVAAHARNCGNPQAESAFDRLFARYSLYNQRKESAYRGLAGSDSDQDICTRIGKMLPQVLLWGRGWRAYRESVGDPALQP